MSADYCSASILTQASKNSLEKYLPDDLSSVSSVEMALVGNHHQNNLGAREMVQRAEHMFYIQRTLSFCTGPPSATRSDP